MKNIYELELHEGTEISKLVQVLRVPGGWIYNLKQGGEVFVPYSIEFEIKNKVYDTLGK
jgi:hypothetical protein